MKLSIQAKGIVLAAMSSVAALALAVAAGEMSHPSQRASSVGGDGIASPRSDTLEQKGHTLFLLNCAHCHGADARGDEGPDLHGLTKSDSRIASLIKNGKKGEMPKFASKLSESEVQALVAFVRSLKD
jgi:mono/diheme cytochrome c family protein